PFERAVATILAAGQKAELREGFREARQFYERAARLAADRDLALALRSRLALGRVLGALGELKAAHDELTSVATRSGEAGLLDVRAAALIGTANLARKQGRESAARQAAAEAEAIATEIGDRVLEIRAIYELAILDQWFDADADAEPEFRRAI